MPPTPAASRRRGCRRGASGVPLQDGGELLHEGVVAHLQAAHLVGEAVVGNHRRDGREQADRRRDQRLGDAGRHHRQRRLLDITERGEGAHDAPDRAEQTHIGTGRADRGERRQAVLEPVDLLQLRHAHRAPRAFEQLSAGTEPCWRRRANSRKPNSKMLAMPGRAAARLDRAIELREVAAGPEVVLELVRLARARAR